MIQTAFEYHRRGQLAEAEQRYRSILAQNPQQLDAAYLLGLLKLQQGHLAESYPLIARVVQARPQDLDALHNLSTVLLGLARYQEALAACDRILSVRRDEPDVLINRAIALSRMQRSEETLRILDRVLQLRPDHPNALFTRGNVMAELARDEEALAAYDRLLTIEPGNADALNNRGNVLSRLKRHTDALDSYERCLAVKPGHLEALSNRGSTLNALLRFEDALASFDKALAINPAHLNALNNRGTLLLSLNRAADALAMFDRALTISPGDAEVLTNRAHALRALGLQQEALASCEQALVANSKFAAAHHLCGHILAKLDRPREAIASYANAMALDPGHPFAFGASVLCHLAACDWGRIEGLQADVERHVRSGRSVVPPFNLLSLPVTPRLQLQCARSYVAAQMPAPRARKPFQHLAPREGERLRVAYLSGDFRVHPVSYLMAELFERHDRSHFEIFGVSYGPDDGSALRQRIAKSFDGFFDVAGKSDQDVARLLHERAVDIAVDLGGHTENSRSAILSARPAPVQVNWLGYAGTMGADFIDYVIADRIVVPFDQQPFYAEQIVHLPNSYLVNDATRAISPQTPTRAQAGLPADGFVFCCFNNAYKLSAPVFEVWMRLLRDVPGSVLWLSQVNEDAARNLRAAAGGQGVDPQRLVFAPRLARMEDHLARHRLADLFLDTLPYNAHTTAADALWAGLPLVTCVGATFAGRVAASLLHAVGLPELVTQDLVQYEALARELATDPARLKAVREKLDLNRRTQALFDTDRFRRHIEAAYATMWDICQRNQPPRSFAVVAE